MAVKKYLPTHDRYGHDCVQRMGTVAVLSGRAERAIGGSHRKMQVNSLLLLGDVKKGFFKIHRSRLVLAITLPDTLYIIITTGTATPWHYYTYAEMQIMLRIKCNH